MVTTPSETRDGSSPIEGDEGDVAEARPPLSGRQERAAETVRRAVSAYAERGLFRGFGFREAGAGRIEFRFRWLTDLPCVLLFDPSAASLTFQDLLPGVAYPSPMDRELRRFVADRSDAGRPAHRRIDPARLEIRCRNRNGSVSLVATCCDRDWSYAVTKTFSLVNEVFLGFLSGPWEDYMVRTFHAPED